MKHQQTLLVIEDNIDTQRTLRVLLRHRGYNVIVFGEGTPALAWLQDNQPDLVILDLMLPDMNGYDVCMRIRQRTSQVALPILMLSALGDEAEERTRGLRAGANDFMAKPFAQNELIERLNKMLNIKQDSDYADHLIQRYVTPVIRREVTGKAEHTHHEEHEAVVLMCRLHGVNGPHAAFDMLFPFLEKAVAAVETSGGTLFDITDDTLLVLFDHKPTISTDAHEAVTCALALQHSFAQEHLLWGPEGTGIGMGIALHHGTVCIGSVGSGLSERRVVAGAALHSARQLANQAKYGEILLSETLYPLLSTAPLYLIDPEETLPDTQEAQAVTVPALPQMAYSLRPRP